VDSPKDDEYPATLAIEYPGGERDRLTCFLRPITAIPIVILLSLVTGPTIHLSTRDHAFESGGLLFGATALMIVFRQKYPRWWFDWNLALTGFGIRVWSYLALLRDEYPSTDQRQAVALEIPYPNAASDLNRWLPLVKWLLLIPHYIVLSLLCVGAVIATLIGWLTILVSGRYPRPAFDFVVGVFRWWLRVAAYGYLLTTDRYPPFRLSA
jgi:Domain of unknown function (DUF4389)